MVLDYRPVTNAPLPKQGPIPAGDWDMALSWGVKEGWMNLKIPALHKEGQPYEKGVNEWAFKECGGRAVVTGCDPIGRINFRASAQIDGDMIRFWRPDNAVTHEVVEGTRLDVVDKPHFRQCFQRATGEFRVLDENPQSPNRGKLTLGKYYEGDWVINWNEHGSHVFHNGPIIQSFAGVFHLYDPLLTKF